MARFVHGCKEVKIHVKNMIYFVFEAWPLLVVITTLITIIIPADTAWPCDSS